MQFTNSFGTFLVSLLSASMAAGAAVPAARSEGASFEVKQVRNDKFGGRNGPLALARAYNKYGIALPSHLAAVVEKIPGGGFEKDKRDSGSVSAKNIQGDLEYLCPVDIGGQTLNLDFDTGSSDLWVFSDEMSSSAQSGHSVYDTSSGQKVSGASWQIKYGDGSTSSGDVYQDDVTIGGLTVKGQAVEAAQQASTQFIQGESDGLVGLAFDDINTVSPEPVKTWFTNIADDLDKPLMVADLKHNEAGSYTFGKIPSGASDILYADVDSSRGFWEFTTETSIASGSISAIADTGTTLLMIDDQLADEYYSQVQGAQLNQRQGGYTFDCDAELPEFSFSVGDGKITVPSELLNYQSLGTGECFGGIQGNQGLGLSIFGDVALKSSYVVFDKSGPSVGWAQKS